MRLPPTWADAGIVWVVRKKILRWIWAKDRLDKTFCSGIMRLPVMEFTESEPPASGLITPTGMEKSVPRREC